MRPKELSKLLSTDVLNICQMLLPRGIKEGNYWVVGSIDGEEGKSLKVYLSGTKQGKFTDYANPEFSGDMLDLWSGVKKISIGSAMREAKQYLGIQDKSVIKEYQKKEFTPPEKPKCKTIEKGSFVIDWYAKRRISPETLRAYKIGIDEGTVVFPYLQGEKLMMYKKRNLKKELNDPEEKKYIFSNKDPWYSLFGWQCIPDDARSVVIVEGENDVLGCYEQGIPALSVPFGGGGGNKQINWIQNEFHNLERFDRIYLMLDMDDPGRDAQKTIVESIGNHHCWIVELPMKDAGKCHKKGLDLWEYIENAKTIDPNELKNAGLFRQEVWDEFYNQTKTSMGLVLPWASTNDKIRFRPAETTIWTGFNGSGKSQVLGHVFVDFMSQKERTCVASMEMKPKKLLKRNYRQFTGALTPDQDKFDLANNFFTEYLWIFNIKGRAKSARIMDVFEYARKRYGVRQFLIDSLAKCGIAEEDYDGQKSFIEDCCDFAEEFDSHIHIVAHSRKKEDESKVPGKMDVRGAGGITDMVDNVITVWRNKPKEKKINDMKARKENIPQELYTKADCVIYCHKQRHGDWEGNINLWYDVNSYQYREQVDLFHKKYF
jgi:twinkle protein